MTEVSALAASTVEVLMLMVVVLVEVVVIGSLFRNAALVVKVAVRRKRFDLALKLGLGRKARAGEATARSGSKQDLYRVQRITIVDLSKNMYLRDLIIGTRKNRKMKLRVLKLIAHRYSDVVEAVEM
jgi:hypothetical protein